MFVIDESGDFVYNCYIDDYYHNLTYRGVVIFWREEVSTYRKCAWIVQHKDIFVLEENYDYN